jgi:hypothetical protein
VSTLGDIGCGDAAQWGRRFRLPILIVYNAWSAGAFSPRHRRRDVQSSAGPCQKASAGGKPNGNRTVEQRYKLPVEM